MVLFLVEFFFIYEILLNIVNKYGGGKLPLYNLSLYLPYSNNIGIY